MNENLGRTAGNAIEVIEAISYLKNEDPCPRLHHVTMLLAAEMLYMGGVCESQKKAYHMAEEALSSGKALEIFQKMVTALGGPADLCEKPEHYLKLSSLSKAVYPIKGGYVASIQTRQLGLAVIELGGGRKSPGAPIDHSVGLAQIAGLNDKVSPNETPLAIIYAKDEATLKIAEDMILDAYEILDEEGPENPIIKKRLAQ
jgi:thymidine phosphorylase